MQTRNGLPGVTDLVAEAKYWAAQAEHWGGLTEGLLWGLAAMLGIVSLIGLLAS